MSNRIAASRMTDRVALAHWAPRESRWARFTSRLLSGLPSAAALPDAAGLSPHLRADVGLSVATAARTDALGLERRRLGF